MLLINKNKKNFINKFREAEKQGFSEQWGVSLATEKCKKDMLYMFEDCESLAVRTVGFPATLTITQPEIFIREELSRCSPD